MYIHSKVLVSMLYSNQFGKSSGLVFKATGLYRFVYINGYHCHLVHYIVFYQYMRGAFGWRNRRSRPVPGVGRVEQGVFL